MSSSWLEKENYLEKEFIFNNFKQAVNFVNKIAVLAEKLGHHPDILIYQYKKVKISLSTHSENKITDKDYLLASQIDEIF